MTGSSRQQYAADQIHENANNRCLATPMSKLLFAKKNRWACCHAHPARNKEALAVVVARVASLGEHVDSK